MTQLISYKGFCGTALATPGLLNTHSFGLFCAKNFHHKKTIYIFMHDFQGKNLVRNWVSVISDNRDNNFVKQWKSRPKYVLNDCFVCYQNHLV